MIKEAGMNCSPCAERGVTSGAVREVAGTPMCAGCFSGKPVKQRQKPQYTFTPARRCPLSAPKPAAIDIGFAVRLLRQARGLSQRQLCERMRAATRPRISRIENGKCIPNFSSILALARALDVTPYILITFATFSSFHKRTAGVAA